MVGLRWKSKKRYIMEKGFKEQDTVNKMKIKDSTITEILQGDTNFTGKQGINKT